MNEEVKGGSENEDSEESELEKACQNVHVNVSIIEPEEGFFLPYHCLDQYLHSV